MATSPTDQARSLDREFALGAHHLFCDAVSAATRAQQYPVANVPPGESLLVFWHLNFPLGRIDYNKPEVLAVLTDMLGIRRMDPCHVLALTTRINDLPRRYGPEGYATAAMTLARARQALADPSSLPGLMTDDELRDAYRVDGRIATGFDGATWLLGAKATAGEGSRQLAGSQGIGSWMTRIAEKLDALDAPAVRAVGRGTYYLMFLYAGFIFQLGSARFENQQAGFRDEMLRRGLAAPE